MDPTSSEDTAGRGGERQRRRGRLVLVIALALAAISLCALAGRHGWEMRRQAWEYFAPGHFRGDIWRNYYFGTLALRDGWLNLYEDHHANPPPLLRRMNYTPLRTLVFARWAAGNGEPEATPQGDPQWKPEWEFNAFLNQFNIVLALAGSIAAGVLVLQWTRWPRTTRGAQPAGDGRDDVPAQAASPSRLGADERTIWQLIWPWVAATIAFLVFWYNPGGLILAHGWPSPNAWLMPFFLWALVFASWNLWFVAGLAIGLGAMFQGQHLLVAPFFLLWPLLAGQPLRAVRWACGFGLGFMGVAAGWMLTLRPDLTVTERSINWTAIIWILSSTIALAALPLVRRLLLRWMAQDASAGEAPDDTAQPPDDAELPASADEMGVAESSDPLAQDSPSTIPHPPHAGRLRRGFMIAVSLVLLLAVVAWPLGRIMGQRPGLFACALLGAMGVIALGWRFGWRALRYAIPGVVAVQLLLCIPLFGASDAWWEVGFMDGTDRHMQMAVGTANNLGAILNQRYDFREVEEVLWVIEPGALLGLPRKPVDVTMRALLAAIYAFTLVLASLATAIQWRRRDPNFLLAATVPWLLMALLPPQMHERYLAFAGLAAAVWIGARGGVGWLLMGGFISCVAYAQIGRCMYTGYQRFFRGLERPFFDREFFDLVGRAIPDLSWALLLAAGIVLFASFTRGRRRRARAISRPPAQRASAEPPHDPDNSAPATNGADLLPLAAHG